MGWYGIELFLWIISEGQAISRNPAQRVRLQLSHCVLEQGSFFFSCSSSEKDGVLETKLREDRKQLCSIASVLHLSEDRAAERVVGDALLDLKDIQETSDDTFMLEESCSTPGEFSMNDSLER
mmetsp:Transcript_38920/g.117059  ORF Transcript_38920/g.117059 Transcript_38920/m.117059 type:complete len:123 (-) Transcript_38920:233-601(-)